MGGLIGWDIAATSLFPSKQHPKRSPRIGSRMGSMCFAVLAFLACADKKPTADVLHEKTVTVEDPLEPEVIVLNVKRYNYPMDEADWLKFDLRSNLKADIKVRAKFYNPNGFVMENGFGFDMIPGQLKPDIVLVPKGPQWVQVELASFLFEFGEDEQSLRCEGCRMYDREGLPITKTAKPPPNHRRKD